MGANGPASVSVSYDGNYIALQNNYYYVALYRNTGSSYALITTKDSGVTLISSYGNFWVTNPYNQTILNIYGMNGDSPSLFQTINIAAYCGIGSYNFLNCGLQFDGNSNLYLTSSSSTQVIFKYNGSAFVITTHAINSTKNNNK
jgi:hypothetical protein